MLRAQDVTKTFGGLRAVSSVSLEVPAGRIVSLIGPNGAGKTTFFAILTGFHKADSGRIHFDGQEITGLAPEAIARRGMVRTFQIVQSFAGQSVRDNIAVGAHLHRASRRAAIAHAEDIAQRVGLGDRLDQEAASLTVAGRKRLEVAKALATDPKLLLLDEVMAGLNPSEVNEVIPMIRSIRDSGVTIMLIEHVMQAVMSLSEHTWVLNQGELIAAGPPTEVARDPAVVEAYLGHGAAERLNRQTRHA